MRVYYITSGLQGCYYYRCLQPLQANGWDGDQTSVFPDQKTPENKSLAAQEADVVVFHRPDDPRKLELARLLKKAGKKIVYDNDDTYKDDNGFKVNKYLDEKRMKKKMASMSDTLDSFIKEADLVTCSTEFLANEYRQLNDKVEVLPNFVDPFMFDEPLYNDTDTFRIGFTGSVGCTADFALATDLVKRIPEVTWVMHSLPVQRDAEVYKKLYHDEYGLLDTLDIEWHPFCEFHEVYERQNEMRLDLQVIPRQDTYFNKCKSNLKFLESSMLGIPVVAQGFADGKSPYQVDKEDAEHMMICHTQDEFEAAIRILMNDKPRCREMGRKAKEYVEKKYDINNPNNHELWIKAYQNLFRSQTLPER